MAKKWYAVQAGRKPGIYTTWADCEAQVKGFGGAVYKSFTSLEEAQAFLEPRGEKRQSLADFFADSAGSGQGAKVVKSANPTSTRIKGNFQRSGQGKSA
ncbi:MAG: RNase H1/viroplasmin domain-containing protein, partial [Veillonella sp.]|nr:RNase H1/viroplasmin domain-containing protein [Veillonella sp.]